MVEREMRLEEARQRALIISERIRQRSDLAARRAIEEFAEPLDYESQLEDIAIAPEAWEHVRDAGIDPKLVFAHSDILRTHPETSLHYRGIATLSLKRVAGYGNAGQELGRGNLSPTTHPWNDAGTLPAPITPSYRSSLPKNRRMDLGKRIPQRSGNHRNY